MAFSSAAVEDAAAAGREYVLVAAALRGIAGSLRRGGAGLAT